MDATSYTYKPSGDVTSIKTVRDGTSTDTQCFAYDNHRRLKEAWTDTAGTTTLPAPNVPGIGGCTTQTPTKNTNGGPDPYWQTFTYDAVGNRTKLVEHDPTDDPTKNITTEYGYRAGTQPTDRTHRLDSITVRTGAQTPVTTSLTYDQAGNIKGRPGADANPQTLTWNEEDKLASVATTNGTSEYVYDADGNRIIRREAGKSTLYLGTDELTTNTNGSGPVVGTRYYPTAGGATVVRNGDAALTYTASDHHGTPVSTLDAGALTATRRQSKPFGEPRGTQPTQAGGQWPDDKGFLGKPMDATGLTHVGAREYDPTLGRFISVDPVMDPTDNQQIHGYTYAGNNPATVSDPSGLFGIGEAIGAAAGNEGKRQTKAQHRAQETTRKKSSNPVGTGSTTSSGNGAGCDAGCQARNLYRCRNASGCHEPNFYERNGFQTPSYVDPEPNVGTNWTEDLDDRPALGNAIVAVIPILGCEKLNIKCGGAALESVPAAGRLVTLGKLAALVVEAAAAGKENEDDDEGEDEDYVFIYRVSRDDIGSKELDHGFDPVDFPEGMTAAGDDYLDGSAYFGNPDRVRSFMEGYGNRDSHGKGVTFRVRVKKAWLANNADIEPDFMDGETEYVIHKSKFEELNKFKRTPWDPKTQE
ncbi:RHS repeat-associated core domain-containing protein [Embleya sp. NPDC005575]|uniref:RHS repeat domain-containing protein n=1 Tax=Embleya sp. NPDC005575 TaxID=3156892 RepID=UPI0033B6550C